MILITIYQSHESKRKSELYFDKIQNELVVEYFDEDGNFVGSEYYRNKPIEFVESIALNWVVGSIINESILLRHKAEYMTEALLSLINPTIHKQQDINEKLSNLLL